MLSPFAVFSDHIGRIMDRANQKPVKKPHVVVLGYGWAGKEFTQSLNKEKYTVQVISKVPKRLNQPKMINIFSPTFTEPPLWLSITEDECLTVDEKKNHIVCKNKNYTYDYLVIATGSEPNTFGLKGVKEHCQMFKTDQDLLALKEKLETGKPVTIAGAGPTGLELAFKLRSMNMPVTVLEASPAILPGFSKPMQQAVSNLLTTKDIQVLLNQKITGVDEKQWLTATGSVKHEGIAIWTCGVMPTEFARNLNLKPDGTLCVRPNIYAAGDCIRGHGPPTAQNAKQQGLYLATLFNKDFKHADYKFEELGRVLDVGDRLILDRGGFITEIPGFLRNMFYAIIE